MRLLPSLLLAGLLSGPAAAQTASTPKTDSLNLRKIYDEALLRGQSYDNLRYLCERIGGRLAGSPQAAQAVEWGKVTMEKANCYDKVYLQECLVRHRVGRVGKQRRHLAPGVLAMRQYWLAICPVQCAFECTSVHLLLYSPACALPLAELAPLALACCACCCCCCRQLPVCSLPQQRPHFPAAVCCHCQRHTARRRAARAACDTGS